MNNDKDKNGTERDQTAPIIVGNCDLSPDARVSNTSKIRLLNRIFLVFVLFTFCLIGLHAAVSFALLDSYTKSFVGKYSDARYAAMLSQQLADLSPTVTIDMKKAIDRQVATAAANERPVNGIFSALMTNSLLGGKYNIPDQVTAEEIIRVARQSNMRGDVGAADIINEKLESHSTSLSVSDSSELENEIAYDKFKSLTFSLKGRMGNGHSVITNDIDEKLTPILTQIREMHKKSQGILCVVKPYRCEINKIRWMVAECNYSRELSGAMGDKCADSVRRSYLEAIGYPTRNEIIFDKCARRFGAHGCSTMVAELPFYMEALVIGYGSFKGE